jgi:uncharacterized protein (DUF1778 family)
MRRDRIDLRVRTEEKEDWRRAAKKEGVDLSELIRREMSQHTSQTTRKLVARDTVVHSS